MFQLRTIGLVLTVLLGMPRALSAQVPELVTDRPDQTESAVVVRRGWVQTETGLLYERDRMAARTTTLSAPTTLVRVGVGQGLELRAAGTFVSLDEPDRDAETLGSELAAGAKLKLLHEGPQQPDAALLLTQDLPCGSEFCGTATEVRLVLAKALIAGVGLGTNLGFVHEESTWSGLYTLTLGFSLAEQVGAFVEVFGTFAGAESPQVSLDGGLTRALGTRLQLDLAAGVALTDASPDFFLGGGLAFRVPR
jgi:hypothetical protein